MNGLFDDLLGDSEPVSDLEPAPHGRDFSLKPGDVHEVERGVTVAWLCQAFAIPRRQIEAKLTGCPAMRTMGRGMKVYDLRVAAAYLVKPKLDIASYIKNLDPKDLPERLKREFWAAKLAEQRWRRQAGELWASEDVIAVFGEVFKLIKSKSQLWADSLDTVEVLSDAQRETLTDLVNDLMSQIFKMLEDLESGRATAGQIAEADDDAEEIG